MIASKIHQTYKQTNKYIYNNIHVKDLTSTYKQHMKTVHSSYKCNPTYHRNCTKLQHLFNFNSNNAAQTPSFATPHRRCLTYYLGNILLQSSHQKTPWQAENDSGIVRMGDFIILRNCLAYNSKSGDVFRYVYIYITT